MPITFDGRTGMSLDWNDLGLVEKVSLGDTVLVNYAYLANGIKKGHKTARPPQGFARPDEITGCLVPKRHGTTYSLSSYKKCKFEESDRVFVILYDYFRIAAKLIKTS